MERVYILKVQPLNFPFAHSLPHLLQYISSEAPNPDLSHYRSEDFFLSSNTSITMMTSVFHRVIELRRKALDKKIGRVGLEVNTSKIKLLSLTGRRTLSIYINGQNMKSVDRFVHLKSAVSVEGGIER